MLKKTLLFSMPIFLVWCMSTFSPLQAMEPDPEQNNHREIIEHQPYCFCFEGIQRLSPYIIFRCGHGGHKQCLSDWFKSKALRGETLYCIICRKELTEGDKELLDLEIGLSDLALLFFGSISLPLPQNLNSLIESFTNHPDAAGLVALIFNLSEARAGELLTRLRGLLPFTQEEAASGEIIRKLHSILPENTIDQIADSLVIILRQLGPNLQETLNALEMHCITQANEPQIAQAVQQAFRFIGPLLIRHAARVPVDAVLDNTMLYQWITHLSTIRLEQVLPFCTRILNSAFPLHYNEQWTPLMRLLSHILRLNISSQELFDCINASFPLELTQANLADTTRLIQECFHLNRYITPRPFAISPELTTRLYQILMLNPHIAQRLLAARLTMLQTAQRNLNREIREMRMQQGALAVYNHIDALRPYIQAIPQQTVLFTAFVGLAILIWYFNHSFTL